MNQNESQEPPVSLEVLQPSQSFELERAHIDVQIATAHKYPRSLAQFQSRALAMVSLDLETAESCLYRRPVGKKKNDKGQWVEEFAEGASVRMAEIVSACYGNIRVACRIVEQTERFVKAEGVAHDLETNNAIKAEVMESTVKADGTPYSERMRVIVAKAVLSKALRDAIFRVVPRALCKTLIDKAREIAIGDEKTLDNRREKVRTWLKTIGVEDARVFAVLNIQGWADLTLEHLETLTGLKTAMKEGDVQINEAFPPIVKAGQIGKTPEGTTTQPAGTAESFDKPYDEIVRRAKVDGVTEAQILAYCKLPEVKLADKHTNLSELHSDKLGMLLKHWKAILPNIRKIEVKA
jgi:hypothetical protein